MFNKRKKETDELIERMKKEVFAESFIADYAKKCGGIKNIKKKNLDKILPTNDYQLLKCDYFMGIYKLVSENETGKLMKKWTIIAGSASVASVIIAIISLIVSTSINNNKDSTAQTKMSERGATYISSAMFYRL